MREQSLRSHHGLIFPVRYIVRHVNGSHMTGVSLPELHRANSSNALLCVSTQGKLLLHVLWCAVPVCLHSPACLAVPRARNQVPLASTPLVLLGNCT